MILNAVIRQPIKDKRKLLRYVSTIVGNEISEISKPCYSPKLIKYKKDLIFNLGITKEDKIEFFKSIKAKYQKFDIFTDDFTITLIISMLFFIREKQKELAKLMFYLLAIKFYGSLLYISFPRFCNDILWNEALRNISGNHLFKTKGGIPNTLVYLADELFVKYQSKISGPSFSDDDLIRMIYYLRHRVSQSIKSFAEIYYKLQKTGVGKGKVDIGEIEEEEKDNTILVAEKISISICTYSNINEAALLLASEKSGIRKEVCSTIVSEISDVSYRNELRFLLILIGKVSTYKHICRNSHKNTTIRKIVTNKAKVFKYIVQDEIFNFLSKTKLGYRLQGYQKQQIIIFFLHYILAYIQNKACRGGIN